MALAVHSDGRGGEKGVVICGEKISDPDPIPMRAAAGDGPPPRPLGRLAAPLPRVSGRFSPSFLPVSTSPIARYETCSAATVAPRSTRTASRKRHPQHTTPPRIASIPYHV